jgi:hypothetical protein
VILNAKEEGFDMSPLASTVSRRKNVAKPELIPITPAIKESVVKNLALIDHVRFCGSCAAGRVSVDDFRFGFRTRLRLEDLDMGVYRARRDITSLYLSPLPRMALSLARMSCRKVIEKPPLPSGRASASPSVDSVAASASKASAVMEIGP